MTNLEINKDLAEQLLSLSITLEKTSSKSYIYWNPFKNKQSLLVLGKNNKKIFDNSLTVENVSVAQNFCLHQ